MCMGCTFIYFFVVGWALADVRSWLYSPDRIRQFIIIDDYEFYIIADTSIYENEITRFIIRLQGYCDILDFDSPSFYFGFNTLGPVAYWGALGHMAPLRPLKPKKSFFLHRKNWKTWFGHLCVSIISQRKFPPPFWYPKYATDYGNGPSWRTWR